MDQITKHYLTCALWSSVDDEGNTLDQKYDVSDVAPESIERAKLHCAYFLDKADPWLDDWTEEQTGHDLWLTRNGHGAGFWDRKLPYADVLTSIAQSMGTSDAYIGGDGLIYLT